MMVLHESCDKLFVICTKDSDDILFPIFETLDTEEAGCWKKLFTLMRNVAYIRDNYHCVKVSLNTRN